MPSPHGTRLVIFDLDETLWTCCSKVCSHLTLPFTRIAPDMLQDVHGERLELLPGARPTIEKLASQGIHLSIASRNDRPPAEQALTLLDLLRFFSFSQIHWGGKDLSIQTILTLFSERAGIRLQPSEVLFIDDWESNVQAASALGIRTLQMGKAVHRLQEIFQHL
jgi:magnesium-dependent phosphatase-1